MFGTLPNQQSGRAATTSEAYRLATIAQSLPAMPVQMRMLRRMQRQTLKPCCAVLALARKSKTLAYRSKFTSAMPPIFGHACDSGLLCAWTE
jgi:hypothetical protein